ncbi:MAG: lipopolysaccharide transport periplasmic protein LptA [Helicobacter sp.]|nr:lipopolysaccharide transport periplasmic protein LptA [Helicobacter sp.]
MKLIFLAIFILIQALLAQTLEVKADKFEANDKTGQSTLIGNVKIKRESDELDAQKVVIFTDKARKIVSFYASGGVNFTIKTNDGRLILGKSLELSYDAKTSTYKLIKNASARERGSQNSIKGDEIILNQKSGKINVSGSKNAPAQFIFKLDG